MRTSNVRGVSVAAADCAPAPAATDWRANPTMARTGEMAGSTTTPEIRMTAVGRTPARPRALPASGKAEIRAGRSPRHAIERTVRTVMATRPNMPVIRISFRARHPLDLVAENPGEGTRFYRTAPVLEIDCENDIGAYDAAMSGSRSPR